MPAIGWTSALLRGGIRFLLLLLVGSSFWDETQAGVNRDYLKYHPPVGHRVKARECIRDFLAKASKARREELDRIRSHVRQLIGFRMGCLRKAVAERRSARRERRKLRRAFAATRQLLPGQHIIRVRRSRHFVAQRCGGR